MDGFLKNTISVRFAGERLQTDRPVATGHSATTRYRPWNADRLIAVLTGQTTRYLHLLRP